MKIRCIETGRITKVDRGEFGQLMITEAMTRLICREPEYSSGGYFAEPIRRIGLVGDFVEFAGCRRAEICRPVGGLTERTGDYRRFEVCD